MSAEGGGAGGGGRPPPPAAAAPAPPPAARPAPPAPVAAQQFVLRQHGGVPALAQLTTSGQGGVTRIISISPQRGGGLGLTTTGPSHHQRPSVANRSIVSALKGGGRPPGARLQLFPPAKRPSGATDGPQPPPSPQDAFATKLQRVVNHRIVRSKLVKEKYAEHLLEAFYLENGGNILDLYAFAKRPKSQAYVAYLRERSIDPKEAQTNDEGSVNVPQTTPSATSASSLPGISNNNTTSTSVIASKPLPPISTTSAPSETPKSTVVKVKTSTPANSTPNQQEQMVEKARQEAHVVQRVADLQREGLWSERRLPRVQEQPRTKAHWDFLLEEMVWLAADFAQERKWKKAAAKKCARMVQKHFQDKALAAQKAEKAHEQHLRRVAALCAKEVRTFWSSVERLVEYKQNTILEEKRKRALDQQLSFIVDQTEKYSQLLAEGMNKSTQENNAVAVQKSGSRATSRTQSDDEFDPDAQSDEDDEETIEQEEREGGGEEQSEEVAALQRESQMELDDLLEDDLLREYLLNRDKIRLSESDDSDDEKEKKDPSSSKKEKEEEKSASEADSDDEENEDEATGEGSEPDTPEEETHANQGTNLKMLVDDTEANNAPNDAEKAESGLIDDAAAIAESIQPKGNTLSSTSVSTRIPFLLKFSLREYQHIGLDWLVTMYDRKLNGILADEMGLGKTIQTIAVLAHLACEQGNWGPHLIVVPTSVMLNWEMECKKWCPAFKILTYYGSQKERRLKRQGWTKPNTFHVCITSYKLVIQDHQSFRRKKWKYLILDEAQNIKNFKSQRWQLLLNFQTERRLLLTGTPLQNNLMELWSLMHFLMPNVFQSHREFKEWFSNPVTGMIEGNSEYNENIIKRLHKVLRPFLLRRLKSEVEKQMPKKYEHVVMCRLSKRQRFLYDDYMSRAKTKETLAGGNLLSVINVLMQLRKVCNHPNLFEVRPTISPFQCEGISLHIPSIVYSMLEYDPFKQVDLYSMNLLLIMLEMHLGAYQCYRMRQSARRVVELPGSSQRGPAPPRPPPCRLNMRVRVRRDLEGRAPPKDKQPPQNVKVKVQGVQLVSQGLVKTIPVMNISQTPGGQTQVGSTTNAGSVLKQSDKISASFAQLVQTSTGKHLLLTSNPNIAGNIPVASTTTPGGQKLTFLSKQPVSTSGNAAQTIAKAFVKFQLTSVTTATTSTTATSSHSPVLTLSKNDELKLKAVNADFIGQLYGKQNVLDVRWGGDDKVDALPGEEDPKGERRRRLGLMSRVNERRCSALPLYGRDFQDVVKIFKPSGSRPWSGGHVNCLNALFGKDADETAAALRLVLCTPEKRIDQLKGVFDRFIFYVPPVKAPEPDLRVWHPPPSTYWANREQKRLIQRLFSKPATPLHGIASAMVTQFPDPRLIQYDCGKLQTLDRLLRRLKAESHRVLIFTQMTKMLDVLEAFLNFHGHIYLRLDGTTKVDQRQLLMERFNGDARIFAFILSTRSGGVGVNLTGADTVIFYDSDWNPTMDAQAQDRCHRIGQTRDVHIYRLVSERTIEENILKKANQKRLLGDLAIEGGNFTTAYFKSSTIQDLFNIDQSEESAARRMAEVLDGRRERENRTAAIQEQATDEKTAVGALENALAACEDDQDVQAARTAKAEAVADLAEFDETVPLDEPEKEPEMSKAEQEINAVIEQLTPVERYAMRFIEETEAAWSAEQFKAAEREIEERKKEWEAERVRALKEEEERRQREMREEDAELITYSREDATNQIWVSDNTMEQMPMWCPPTPPQQDSDVYVDHSLGFLYEPAATAESRLPTTARSNERRDAKRSRTDHSTPSSGGRPAKIARRDDPTSVTGAGAAPRSLFHSPAILKMRRDLRLQRYRGGAAGGRSAGTGTRPGAVEQPPLHEWTVHEDAAILKVLQGCQRLPINLAVMSPAHTPNWDFVSDYVNTVSITYRSSKQCRARYEGVLMAREEGKTLVGAAAAAVEGALRKKKAGSNKGSVSGGTPVGIKARPARTAHLLAHDNNSTFTQVAVERCDALRAVAGKRSSGRGNAAVAAPQTASPQRAKASTSAPALDGIDLDHPVMPVEVAAKRAERIAKEKRVTHEQLAKLQQLRQAQAQNAPVVVASPGTPPAQTRTPRIVAAGTSPAQPTTPTASVVSVSGLSAAQLQAATQRLIVSAGGANATPVKAAVGTPGKQLAQMIRQGVAAASAGGLKQQLRLHAGAVAQVVKTTQAVSIAGAGQQQALVQFTQAAGAAQQQPRAQLVRQATPGGAATVKTAGGVARTVTESEVAQLLRKQTQLQQHQKLQAAGGGSQVFAQAIQQAGAANAQPVATLVKTVTSTGGVTQTVTIPVSLSSSAGATKAALSAGALKAAGATSQQLRQLQAQLLAQKKLAAAAASQKAAAAGKAGAAAPTAQLVYGAPGGRPLQLQQLVRAPTNAARLLASPRQALLRPQLAGLKVGPQGLLQQVAGARVGQARAPAPLVTVGMQQAAAMAGQQQLQQQQQHQAEAQVSRFVKRQ